MVAQPYPWVLETAEERASRLRKEVETDEERHARFLNRVESVEERAARLRKNLVCSRWKREETLFKQVHELAMDFECEAYLIVQHHGEKDRQVYHSQPEKKEWVTDYRTLLEECWPPIVENNRKTMGPTKKQLMRRAKESQSQSAVVDTDQTSGFMDTPSAQIPPAPAPETPTPQDTARPTGPSHSATALRPLKRRWQDVEDGIDEDDSNYNSEDSENQVDTAAHDPVIHRGNASAHHGSHVPPRVDRVAQVNSVTDGAIPPKANIGVNRGSADNLPPPKPVGGSVGPPSAPRAAPPKRGAMLAQGLARMVHDVNRPPQGSQPHPKNGAPSGRDLHLRLRNPNGVAPSRLQRHNTSTLNKTPENETYEQRRFEFDPDFLMKMRRERSQSSEPPFSRPRLQKATRRVPKRPKRLKYH